ncbi:MAG: hypothetical protein JSU87_07385 [Gemmatimonadota bacterium]|nr:MAG: hypothetical protein JSU87_07385 [Gemmatimonadota bacterium]
MGSPNCRRGYSLVDTAVMVLLLGTVLGTAAPLGQRVVANYQLNTAVRALSSEVAETKIRAVKVNSVATVKLESNREYTVVGSWRQLPNMVRFDRASDDSLAFNGLGALTAGTTQRLVLVNRFDERRELRVYAAGGHEIRKL